MATSNPKRVLVPVSNPLGGIRTYMLYNFKPIERAGYHFTFLAPAGHALDTFRSDWSDCPETEFLSFAEGESMWRAIHSALKSNRYQLIHSQGLRAGTEAAIGNYFAKIPHLITLHDVIVPQNDVPGKMKWLKKRISEFFTKRATVIIPVSRDCSENHLAHFSRWKKGPCRIEVISNGINVKGLLESRECFRQSGRPGIRNELGIDEQVVLGGFFGRFMPQKGFKYLLEALSELARRGFGHDRFRLIATKDAHGYRDETIRSVAERPEVAPMVHFVEPVADIAPLMSQMDVLVMPSLWEACGLLAMEAMVLGVPVIGSDAIGLREVLHDTPSVMPPKENYLALADAIEKYINHPFTNQAKAFETEAQQRFDVVTAADQLLDIYQSL